MFSNPKKTDHLQNFYEAVYAHSRLMTSQKHPMKSNNIKATYILTINFKPVLKVEENSQFSDRKENRFKVF